MIATAEKVHCFRPPQVKVPAEFPSPCAAIFILCLYRFTSCGIIFKELWLTYIGKQR